MLFILDFAYLKSMARGIDKMQFRNLNVKINCILIMSEDEFKKLVKQNLRSVYNLAYRYANNKNDAEDITQEAFLKAWKNVKKFDAQKNFKTWVLTIAKNTTFDFLRKRKSLVFSDMENSEGENKTLENIENPSPLPNEIFEQKELAKNLNLAFEKLPPNFRAVLSLHYNEELAFEEIASILEKPMNTVKSWHYRALKILRNLLTKDIQS